MIKETVDAHVHFKHQPWEVAALDKATIPLRDTINAIAKANEKGTLSRILKGQYFRKHDALHMCRMLRAVTKSARANVQDYFPGMREARIAAIEDLEDAIEEYWDRFQADTMETMVTH
jgi:hypothetical protein